MSDATERLERLERENRWLRHGKNWDDFRIEFDDDGALHLRGRNGWQEAICPICNEPIRWILDMFSFCGEPHDFRLAHARCVWTAEGFTNQAEQVVEGEGMRR